MGSKNRIRKSKKQTPVTTEEKRGRIKGEKYKFGKNLNGKRCTKTTSEKKGTRQNQKNSNWTLN